MAISKLKIETAGHGRIDELRDLWLSLHHHHQTVAALQPLIADDELSWRRRRALYAEALVEGRGFLVIATKDDRPVGYAMIRIHHGPDDTWPLGDQYAELYSLSVTPAERGNGIGGALFEAVQRELSRREIVDLVVAVMTGNTAAMRFYERRGLRPGEILLYRFGRP